MAGRTPTEAVRAFADPIQRALTCFAHGRVTVDSYDPAKEGSLAFNDAEDVLLKGPGRVAISVAMRYQIVKQRELGNPRRPWKVSTTEWICTVADPEGPIADFHWHPARTPTVLHPHLHARRDPKRRHLPTGRVLVEDVLMFAVECGAAALDATRWEATHRANIERFDKGATWGLRRPRP